jgi:hypothetical protein
VAAHKVALLDYLISEGLLSGHDNAIHGHEEIEAALAAWLDNILRHR